MKLVFDVLQEGLPSYRVARCSNRLSLLGLRARLVRAGDHDLVFLETLYLRTVLAVLRRLAARAAFGGGCSRRTVRVVLLPLCDGDLSFGTASLLLSLSLGLSYLCEIFLGL